MYILFSLAMFLVTLGYDDKSVQENLFTRWFSAGLGLVILSLGEYEVCSEPWVHISYKWNRSVKRVGKTVLNEFSLSCFQLSVESNL